MSDLIKNYAAALLTVLVGSALVWLLLGRPLIGIDDADIFLVYARNFADGHGFVYNIGGEHVEGFTSMLWVQICALFFRFTRMIEGPILLLNLLLGSIVLFVCLKRVERRGIFIALFCAAPAWFAWSGVTLMESGLWCLLLTLMVLAVLEKRVGWVTALMPLLVICRPESMLWGAWIILMLGLSTQRVRAVIFPVVTFAAALAGLIVFRIGYFGFPVPNTYYAKVSQDLLSNLSSGFVYLYEYVASNPAVLLVIGLYVWILFRELRKKEFSRSLIVGLCLLPGLGIPVLVGGDHFGGHRFYQPIWPLLCLLAAWNFPVLKRWQTRVLLLVLVVVGWALFPWTANMKHEFRIAREGRMAGATLEAMFRSLESLPTVAVITAGGSKYAYPGHVYDVMGLNSSEMAHAPATSGGLKNHTAFNREVFYTWYPDILVRGDSDEFDFKVLKGLHAEPLFLERYVKGELQYNNQSFSAYYSIRFLESLPDAQYTFRPEPEVGISN